MAKVAAKALNISVNSVALEDDASNVSLEWTQAVPVVTSIADAGPRRVADNYDYSVSLSGAADFASGQSDATLAGLIGSAGVVVAVDPTGNSAGANDPNYDSTSMVLESYKLTAQVGGAVMFDAKLAGNSALARAVA